MKNYPFFYFLTLILLTCPLKKLYAQHPRIEKLFDENWKFYKGDIANGEREYFDDKDWRDVELPHDWSIEDLLNQCDSIIGPFSKSSVGGTSTGYTTGGTSWYRKHFTLSSSVNKKVFIYFDGVYMNCDVWINGHYLGNHPYGYTGFSYDLTPYLNPAKDGRQNIVAVKVRNEGKNSRWYSGSGIYRHVWLTITNPLHIPQWGVFITTSNVSESAATVNIKTSIADESDIAPVVLRTRLLDATGKTVAVIEKKVANSNKTNDNVYQSVQIKNPHLWSPDDPYLYKAVSEVWKTGKLIDVVVNTFGVRSIHFSAVTGFLLNGKKTLLRGGSVHHDNGPLGSAAIDRAEERKVELLKSFGFNAVRTSHNPPSAQFLNACDKLGLLVIDEAFDQWQKPKNPQDYHRFFSEWWQKDLSSMVMRDRNHPSVIIWSIGNEIKERADSSGLAIAKQMRDEVYSLDSSRPVTQAICDFWDNPGYKWDTTKFAFALLDIGGYNYMWKQYQDDHKKFPQRIMAGTESFANEAFENWQQVEKHPYVIGDFVWTAMDYMGETAIGHSELDTIKSVIQLWPWFNAYRGDVDLIGNKKPQSYYGDIIWKRRNIAMLVHAPIPKGHKELITQWGWPDEYPSWNYLGKERTPLQVKVYTRFPAVRIELND
ncbi:MAG TPA: glycoside hydrolase family 2 TIM barrel-domain containing protein, partial [Segetibacter sp.]|nr:glycoside hydrolase family 2 TIM barrel-domain containing protein [Segetibacter sp.]